MAIVLVSFESVYSLMDIYTNKPDRFLEEVYKLAPETAISSVMCAGFELKKWRCEPFADHLINWLADYALAEDELNVHHGNIFDKLKKAAVRIYTSAKYSRRGEAGEIALHAICRDFFNTIPIAPRIFYKSASNDPIKSFDLVHARFPTPTTFEVWLGESKFYTDASQAVAAAVTSIKDHIQHGFLKNEKILLGPTIAKNIPQYEEIIKIFKSETSIDKLLEASVFVVGICADSEATKVAETKTPEYIAQTKNELEELRKVLDDNALKGLKLALVYVPLASKEDLAKAFDRRLKGLQ